MPDETKAEQIKRLQHHVDVAIDQLEDHKRHLVAIEKELAFWQNCLALAKADK